MIRHTETDDFATLLTAVTAITLKSHPKGDLETWIIDSKVDISVVGIARRRNTDVWLSIDELEQLHWATQIVSADIASDHFDNSWQLHNLVRVERLVVYLRGSQFDEHAAHDFWMGVYNLGSLKQLEMVVEPEALEFCENMSKWPNRNLTVTISCPTKRPPKKKRSI